MGGFSPEKRGSSSQEESLFEDGGRGRIAAWLALLKASWQTVLTVDRSNITAFQAIRSAFGMGLPLVLGIVTNQVSAGVLVASGALMLGSVGLKDPYRSRTRSMVLAGVFVTLSALIAILLAPSPVLLPAIVILAAYLMFTTLLANYTIFSLATTMAVVFLLAFIHAPTLTTTARARTTTLYARAGETDREVCAGNGAVAFSRADASFAALTDVREERSFARCWHLLRRL